MATQQDYTKLVLAIRRLRPLMGDAYGELVFAVSFFISKDNPVMSLKVHEACVADIEPIQVLR